MITPNKIISQLSNFDNIYETVIELTRGTFDYIDFLTSCQKVKEISKKQNLLKLNKELESLLKNSEDVKVEELERLYQKTFERNIEESIEEDEDIMHILDNIIERKKRYEEGKPFIEIDTGYEKNKPIHKRISSRRTNYSCSETWNGKDGNDAEHGN